MKVSLVITACKILLKLKDNSFVTLHAHDTHVALKVTLALMTSNVLFEVKDSSSRPSVDSLDLGKLRHLYRIPASDG
jgi:hypothetical protein